MVCAQRAGKGLAHIGGAKGRREVQNRTEEEGRWVCESCRGRGGIDVGGAAAAVGERGLEGWLRWVSGGAECGG